MSPSACRGAFSSASDTDAKRECVTGTGTDTDATRACVGRTDGVKFASAGGVSTGMIGCGGLANVSGWGTCAGGAVDEPRGVGASDSEVMFISGEDE